MIVGGKPRKRKTEIGWLKRGDYFLFEGVIYKVGRLIKNANGYVACTNIHTKKTKRFHIDTEVEVTI